MLGVEIMPIVVSSAAAVQITESDERIVKCSLRFEIAHRMQVLISTAEDQSLTHTRGGVV